MLKQTVNGAGLDSRRGAGDHFLAVNNLCSIRAESKISDMDGLPECRGDTLLGIFRICGDGRGPVVKPEFVTIEIERQQTGLTTHNDLTQGFIDGNL